MGTTKGLRTSTTIHNVSGLWQGPMFKSKALGRPLEVAELPRTYHLFRSFGGPDLHCTLRNQDEWMRIPLTLGLVCPYLVSPQLCPHSYIHSVATQFHSMPYIPTVSISTGLIPIIPSFQGLVEKENYKHTQNYISWHPKRTLQLLSYDVLHCIHQIMPPFLNSHISRPGLECTDANNCISFACNLRTIHIQMDMYVYVSMYLSIYRSIYLSIHPSIRTYVRTHVPTYIHTYINPSIQTNVRP